jgi:translation initiation factor 2 gamma subunit (eIF-2gamma)
VTILPISAETSTGVNTVIDYIAKNVLTPIADQEAIARVDWTA